MADWKSVCDAIITDLQANVTGLDTTTVPAAKVHRYEPWSPDDLQPDGTRHLAVWPIGGTDARLRQDLATYAEEFICWFDVLIWEGAELESARQVADETAASTLLQIEEDAAYRLRLQANQNIGGADYFMHETSAFPERSTLVRWVRLRCRAHFAKGTQTGAAP